MPAASLPFHHGEWKTSIMPVECHSSDYFRRREAKELALADRASAEDIRDIYLSLADWYRLLAENAEQEEHKSERAVQSLQS